MSVDDRAVSQADRFKETARKAECDEDEATWERKLREIAKQKPKDVPPRN